MSILLKLFLGWGLPDWASKLLATLVPVLLVLGAIWWWGDSRYHAGEADEKARWEDAIRKANEVVDDAIDDADDAADEREADWAEIVEQEKERIDAAVGAGTDPLDELFDSF